MRHGEIQSNTDKIYAGWNNEALTQNGRQQVRMVSKDLAAHGIDMIFCSPLKRAIETSEILSNDLDLKFFIEKSFNELKLGKWEGKSETLISEIYPDEWETWNTKPAELVVEGRETLGALLERILRGIKNVKKKFQFNSPLIVTHVSVIRALILYSKNIDMNQYKTIPIPNAKVFNVSDRLLC